jgi:hypothetical protein
VLDSADIVRDAWLQQVSATLQGFDVDALRSLEDMEDSFAVVLGMAAPRFAEWSKRGFVSFLTEQGIERH